MSAYKELLKQIDKRNFTHPVYFFYGEESYFIDKLTEQLEDRVLDSNQKSFNLDILYGPDLTPGSLIAILRAYPTMAPYRLVIVKEAHKIRKDYYEKLASYLEKPVPSTIVAFVHKAKSKPEGKFGRLLTGGKATLFESKTLYESQVPAWVKEYVESHKTQIEADALQILVQSLGNNLQLIENEINKMLLHLHSSETKRIDKNLVYEFVAIDKDFNVFELINHIGARNNTQAHKVMFYLMRNTRENSPIMILGQLFTFFSKLAHATTSGAKTEKEVTEVLKINPYFAKQYTQALQNFNYEKIQSNLTHILDADLALKGVTNTRMGEPHIMITLLYQLL